MIKLIVGLGNPGDEHLSDRHNAGFWLCDILARNLNCSFSVEKSQKALVSKAQFNQQNIWIIKPQTYMNLSGEAVGAIAKFYQIDPSQILVIHDELDLPAGVTRLKSGGGTGGHNGLKSINTHLGTPNYWRLRVGIGHPRDTVPPGSPHQEVASYVLKRPPQKEMDLIEQSFAKVLQVLPQIISGDLNEAMKLLHTQ
jgi:peptidyl-tRNA hydrolase, PTH1 family